MKDRRGEKTLILRVQPDLIEDTVKALDDYCALLAHIREGGDPEDLLDLWADEEELENYLEELEDLAHAWSEPLEREAIREEYEIDEEEVWEDE